MKLSKEKCELYSLRRKGAPGSVSELRVAADCSVAVFKALAMAPV